MVTFDINWRHIDMLRFFHSRLKRQAMVCLAIHSFFPFCSEIKGREVEFSEGLNKNSHMLTAGRSLTYRLPDVQTKRECLQSIARAIQYIEKRQGWRLYPTEIKKVAIFLDDTRAPGLVVRLDVIEAVQKFLELRNYSEENVLFVAKSRDFPVNYGFLKDRDFFLRHQFVNSQKPSYFNPLWYYESSMPPSSADKAQFFIQNPNDYLARLINERKSMLPACLFEKDVHWINLSVLCDNRILGIEGAVSNLTLNACSNTGRFHKDPTIGHAASVEILAIPEFWEKRLFSILDLSNFQVAGGPNFDAEFVYAEEVLLIGDNPVALDYYGIDYLSEQRKKLGLQDRTSDELLLFKFARELGIMNPETAAIEDIRR